MATSIVELREQAKNLERQIKEFERMNLDAGSLESALSDIETRICELENEGELNKELEGKQPIGEVKLRESGKLEPRIVPVYDGDTYVDIIERNGIKLYINGQERKVRDNRGSVDGAEGRPNILSPIDICCVDSIFIGMPKIDGNHV